ERLGANAAPIQIPIGNEHQLRGAIDLIKMKAFTYKGIEDKELTEEEIPADIADMDKDYRKKLIEAVAEYDDEVLNKYLEGQELTELEIKRAIRKGTVSGKFFPILGGDTRMATVQMLLDAVVEYLPSPSDVPPVKGLNPKTNTEEVRHPKNEEPFA